MISAPASSALQSVIAALYLTDENGRRCVDARGKRLRIAEREHQRGWAVGKRDIEQTRLVGQRPSDEATADALVARCRKFLFEPVSFPIAAADQPETARLAHRASQTSTGNATHGCQQNWMLDAKFFGKARTQGHNRILRSKRSVAQAGSETLRHVLVSMAERMGRTCRRKAARESSELR